MTMIKKVLVLLMVSTAWAAPLRPEVPEVKKFHEAMAEVKTTETIDTDWETIPEVKTTGGQKEFPEVMTTETGTQTEEEEFTEVMTYDRTFSSWHILLLVVFFTTTAGIVVMICYGLMWMIRGVKAAIMIAKMGEEKDLERGENRPNEEEMGKDNESFYSVNSFLSGRRFFKQF